MKFVRILGARAWAPIRAVAESSNFSELSREDPSIQSDPTIESVLAKLDPEDRKVIDEALAKAQKTEAELRYIADHDSLTGLLDRRRFRAELDQYVPFTARYGG